MKFLFKETTFHIPRPDELNISARSRTKDRQKIMTINEDKLQTSPLAWSETPGLEKIVKRIEE